MTSARSDLSGMTSVLANAFIVYIIVVTCILKQGNFDNCKIRSCGAFRCRCKVKANVFDAAPSYDFGLIYMKYKLKSNNKLVRDSRGSSQTCRSMFRRR